MKKVLSIIMTVSMILSCAMMYSCGATENVDKKTNETIRLNPYELYGGKIQTDGGLDSSFQTSALPEEWKTSRDTYQDKSAPKSYTIEVLGKKYTHSYTESREYSLISRPQDDRIYHSYGDIDDAFFTIDAKNQKVVAWRKNYERGIFKTDGNANKVYDMNMAEVERIAQGYVKDLVGEDRAKEYIFSNENGNFYFRRHVNGYKTNEYITIVLQSDGTLYSFRLENIGLYDGVSDFAFDEKKAENMVRDKVKECYQDKQYNIQKMDIQVQMLPNGQMAYKYIITTAFCVEQYEDGSADWGGETFSFVIPAE